MKNDMDYLEERSRANPKGQEAIDVQKSRAYTASLLPKNKPMQENKRPVAHGPIGKHWRGK